MNIIKLSDVLNDGAKLSVVDMLKEAIERIEGDLPHIKKALVLLWDEKETMFEQIKWHQAGMNRREHLALLSKAKDEYLIEYAFDHQHD